MHTWIMTLVDLMFLFCVLFVMFVLLAEWRRGCMLTVFGLSISFRFSKSISVCMYLFKWLDECFLYGFLPVQLHVVN